MILQILGEGGIVGIVVLCYRYRNKTIYVTA